MARDDRKVRVVLGIPEDKQVKELSLPPEEPDPWDLESRFTTAGTRVPRLDAVQKVTGAARYAHDIQLPGLLFGGFYRAPLARGELLTLDSSAAEAVSGVVAVQVVLEPGRRVRYADQPVLALAAESRQALEEAIRSVKATYRTEPHAATMPQSLAEDAPQVHGNRPNATNRGPSGREEAVEVAFAAADRTVEATCTTQIQTHACLETHGATAHWDGSHLKVWASTQATFGVQGQLARSPQLGLDASQITVLSEFMGGGFGSKFSAGYWGLYAALLSKATGRPVKMMLDRREEHTDSGMRPSSVQEMKLAVSRDGTLGAYRIRARGTGGVSGGTNVANPMIYDFPRELVDSEQVEVATNTGPAQAARAPGHPQGSFGLEAILDLAAAAIDMDPLELRLKNDSNPVRRRQWREGAKLIGWEQRPATGSARGRFRRGMGLGGSRWGGLGGPRGEVLCRIHPDGSIEVRNGAQDIGTGTRTLLAIVVAEELAVSVDRITTFIGDTNDPLGPGSGGSQTAPTLAPAARQAAFLAGRELLAIVAENLKGKPEDWHFEKGNLVRQDGAMVDFGTACRLLQDPITVRGRRLGNYDTYQGGVAGCQFADVTVDTDFGTVKVNRIVAIQDAGLIMNRLAAESQVLGAVIQGVSYALFEEKVIDRQKGFQVNADMEMYKIAGPRDVPEIEVVLTDVANGGNNTSVCGIGEPPMVPTAAAIAGAVHNALGVRVNSLPMTPDKVLAALETQEQGR